MTNAAQTFLLVAATYTPFHADGSLNLDVIDGYARVLAERGVSDAFVCGTTGEGLSLSLDERMQVAQRWQAVAGDDLGVIVHVGHTALPDAQALAAHAQSIGAKAIASIGPTFFHPVGMDDLVEWCAQIAAAAPDLPFYYYHFPAMNSPRLPMTAFLQQASARIPTFAGIKFTDENLMEFHTCLDVSEGRYAMLFGRDEILLSALVLGARGAVGSTYNLISPIFRQMIAAFDGGRRGCRTTRAGARSAGDRDNHRIWWWRGRWQGSDESARRTTAAPCVCRCAHLPRSARTTCKRNSKHSAWIGTGDEFSLRLIAQWPIHRRHPAVCVWAAPSVGTRVGAAAFPLYWHW